TASGPLGTNAQYLFLLDQELRKLGMHDTCLDDLVANVKALLGVKGEQGIASLS
ncbi:gamma-glutamylcyclotransferase, partial [Salmonella enterica]